MNYFIIYLSKPMKNKDENFSLKEYNESYKEHKLDLIDDYKLRTNDRSKNETNAQVQDSIKIKKRTYTLNVRPSPDQRFLRVLIPFDLEIKKFYLPPEELEIYDVKDYIQQTIDKFNNMKEFHIHEDYQGRGIILILSWILFLVFHLSFGYISLCILTLTYCNLILVLFLIKLHVKFQSFVNDFFKKYYNKVQFVKIKLILDKENESEYCKYRKYTWTIGEVGYWLEMTKEL